MTDPTSPDPMLDALRQAWSGRGDPKAAAQRAAEDAKRDEALAAIAERLLGIRADHGDPIYTQQPMMAGVLREALRQAFAAGQSHASEMMLTSLLAPRSSRDKGRV